MFFGVNLQYDMAILKMKFSLIKFIKLCYGKPL